MLVDNTTLKRKIIQYVIDKGYTFPDTMNAFRRIFKRNPENLPECSMEDLDKVNKWIELHCTQNTEYQAKVRSIWGYPQAEVNDSVTDRNKDAIYYYFSAANIALNEQPERDRIEAEKKAAEQAKQDRLNSPENRYAGEVGDLVEFIVAEVTVAGRIEIPVYPYASYPLMKMLSTDGLYYTWGNSGEWIVNPGDQINGKIKALKTDRDGTKLTQIFRVKITKPTENNIEDNNIRNLFKNIR